MFNYLLHTLAVRDIVAVGVKIVMCVFVVHWLGVVVLDTAASIRRDYRRLWREGR